MTRTHPGGTALDRALATVDEARYVRRPDGTMIAQSSSPRAIRAVLDRLDVEPGATVLEIGTGSGYSTALLAELAGPDGRVVTVDVVPDLVDRVPELFTRGCPVTAHLADGLAGQADHAPYDRIVAWATAPHLPRAWVDQCRTGARIVAPFDLTTLSTTGAGAVIEIDRAGAPRATSVFAAGYVAMHDTVVTQWLVPPTGVDARLDRPDGAWWLSAEFLRTGDGAAAGDRLLRLLADSAGRVDGPLTQGEDVGDFRAWLLAARPTGLAVAGLGTPEWRLGHAAPDGVALTSVVDGCATVVAGAQACVDVLCGWAERWRAAGRPGFGALTPTLEQAAPGWFVRALEPDEL